MQAVVIFIFRDLSLCALVLLVINECVVEACHI